MYTHTHTGSTKSGISEIDSSDESSRFRKVYRYRGSGIPIDPNQFPRSLLIDDLALPVTSLGDRWARVTIPFNFHHADPWRARARFTVPLRSGIRVIDRYYDRDFETVRILFRHAFATRLAPAERNTCRNCVSRVCSDNNFVSPRKSRRSAFRREGLECLMKGNLLMELARPELRVQMPWDARFRLSDTKSIFYRHEVDLSSTSRAAKCIVTSNAVPKVSFAVTLVTLRFYNPPARPPSLSLSFSLAPRVPASPRFSFKFHK